MDKRELVTFLMTELAKNDLKITPVDQRFIAIVLATALLEHGPIHDALERLHTYESLGY